MGRFYFHIESLGHRDHDGLELPTLVDAQHEALKTMAEMVGDMAEAFWGDPSWRLVVTDQTGLALLSLEVVGMLAPAASPQQAAPGRSSDR